MTTTPFRIHLSRAAAVILVVLPNVGRADDRSFGDGSVVMRAMTDELERSMDLQLEDLEKPYFIAYDVVDSASHTIYASYGAIYSSSPGRSRNLRMELRVGSPELDNTNFTGDGFSFFRFMSGSTSLPIEDDYLAIRHGIWSATDASYKGAVETLTKKRAYLKDKEIEDRPNDFSAAPVLERSEPVPALEFDEEAWGRRLRSMTSKFSEYPQIQDSGAYVTGAAKARYFVNSEGTRVRTGDTDASLSIWATIQSDDGMEHRDGLEYAAETAAGLPTDEKIGADIEEMVARMTAWASAPKLENYIGPVLFEGEAAAVVLREMLAEGVVGRADSVGTQRRSGGGARSLEKKLDKRILPKTFHVYDDPGQRRLGDTLLEGHYRVDDEGVVARRVDLVQEGKLVDLLMSRGPTKDRSTTNGHGRRQSFASSPQSAISNLFIEDEDGVPDAELQDALFEVADDEGLDSVIVVTALAAASGGGTRFFFGGRGGGGSQVSLPDPLYVYRLYVEDGRRELVRGCEFDAVSLRALKRIVATGKELHVHNRGDSAVIAPSIVFEEMELNEIEQELDKPPLTPGPVARMK